MDIIKASLMAAVSGGGGGGGTTIDLFEAIKALPTLAATTIADQTFSIKVGSPIANVTRNWSRAVPYEWYLSYVYSQLDLFLVAGDVYAQRINYGSVGERWIYNFDSYSGETYLTSTYTNPWITATIAGINRSSGSPYCYLELEVDAGYHSTYYNTDGSIASESDEIALSGSTASITLFTGGSINSGFICNCAAMEFVKAMEEFYMSEWTSGTIIPIYSNP